MITIHILNNETFHESLYYISDSPIHGKGVFASVKINKDSDLGIIILNGVAMKMYRRYEHDRIFKDHRGEEFKEHRGLARFLNHSDTPNAEIIVNNNSCSLKTIKEINEGDEITANYRPFRDKYMGGYMMDIN